MPALFKSHSLRGGLIAAVVFSLVGVTIPITPAQAAVPAPVITATKAAAIPVHVGGGARPGDTINYTVTIHNSGSVAATGVNFNDTVDPNSTLVPDAVPDGANTPEITPIAQNDSYSAVGNVGITVPAGQGVLANDNAPDGDPLTVSSPGTVTTSFGGNLAMNADGSFTYNPPAGKTGTDTIPYTISDGEGHSDSANLSITVTGTIWFVNVNAGSNGDGRLSSPYNCLVGSGCLSSTTTHTGDTIFLYTSTGNTTYNGNLTLLNNQRLVGQAATASLSSLAGVTPPAYSNALPATGNATAPSVVASSGVNVQLAQGNLVQGVALNSSGGTALAGNGFGTFTAADDVVANTGGTAINLNSGTLAATFASVSASGCTGTDGLVLTNTSGSIVVTGNGSTGGSGGTIQHCTGSDGSTAQGIGVYLASANGVSLNFMNLHDFDNFAIYGNGVSGFTLNHSSITGTNGTNGATPYKEGSVWFSQLTGSNIFSSDTISGGRLDNVHLENTSGTLTSAAFSNCTIQNNSTSTDGNSGLAVLSDLTAVMTVTVSNCQFNGNRSDTMQASAADSSTLNFAATNNTITAGTGGNNQGNIGIDYNTALTSTGTFDLNGNTISGLANTGISVFAGNTSSISGLIRSNIITNTFVAPGTSNGWGIHVFQNSYSAVRANVSGNTVSNIATDYGILADAALNVTDTATPSAGQALLQVALTNNTANVLSGALDAMRVQARVHNTVCARISGNTSTNAGSGFDGLYIRQGKRTSPSATVNATFKLEGLAGGLQTAATTQAYLAGQNPAVTDTVGTQDDTALGFTGVASNSCSIPTTQFNGPTPVASFSKHLRTKLPTGNATRHVAHHFARPHTSAATGARSKPMSLTASGGTLSAALGTLPAGHTVVITYSVTTATSLTAGQISNQGTVSGSNFSNVLTDDPSTVPANDPTVTQVIIPTTFTLVSSNNPATLGDPVTFTATATDPTGNSVPTGNVQFTDNGNNLGSPVVLDGSGVAQYVASGVTALSLGSHTITAVYTPTSGTAFAGHTATLSPDQMVNVSTTTSVSSSKNPSTTGDALTFTASVAQVSGSTVPTGTVQFSYDVGETPLGGPVALVNGQATSQSISSLNAGNHQIKAVYTPTSGSGFLGSFGTLLNGQQVYPPLSITSGNSATFVVGVAVTSSQNTFTVTTDGSPTPSLSDGGATLPGGVTFVDNGNGTATLAGTPAAGSGGTYTFTITAHNGAALDVTQTFTLTVNEAPAITSANHVTFQTGISGTFSVTTTGFPQNPGMTVSDGGATLPTGVTFVDNGNGTATLSGTPAANTGGTYPFTITASNGVSPDATQSYTLTVNQGPAITSANSTSFQVGTGGTFSVTTSGFPNASLSDGGATLPSGVTFVDNGNGTATLSGTPAVNTGGSYAFTITAHNGVTPDATQSFTLTVNQAPAITSANHVTFQTGVSGTFSVTTTGYPKNPGMTVSDGGASLPTGVTFIDNGNGTATLSGTPGANTGGTYPFTITAGNGISPDATQSFTLIINQAPAITSTNHVTFQTGVSGTFSVTTTGYSANAGITLSDGTATLPSGVSFVDNGNGTATLSGTPAAASGGSYAFTITAHNGVTPDATQLFTLTVNQPPAITSANHILFLAGAPVTGSQNTFTVTTTGYPAPTLSDGGATLPSGVTFVDNGNGTATLAGTPAAGTGGTYPFTISAGNGVSSGATQSFTLTVSQAPAVTSADHVTFQTGSSGTFTVTSSGSPNPSLSDGSATLPSGVTFVDNGNGTATLAGTPGATTGGVYTFTITASNGISPAATQSFTLTVNQAPAITSAASTTFLVGAAVSGSQNTFKVTTTGFPSGTQMLIGLSGGTLPSGVTLVDNHDGTATLSGVPAAGTGGTYLFNITASNGVTPTAIQPFVLTVNEAPAITSANHTTFQTGNSGTFSVTTTGYPKSPGMTVSDGSATLPSGVTFVDNGNGTATLAGTPGANAGGVYTFTITASNGVSPAATQTFTLTVNQAPAITSADHATFQSGVSGTFSVTTTGYPTTSLNDGGATLPGGVTFVDNGNGTATLAGTPAANSGGTYTFTITAGNGISPAATQTFTLTVNQAPAITSANHVTFQSGVSGTFSVTTTGFPKNPGMTLSDGGATLPTGVTFVDNGNGTATLSGTPGANAGGSYPFTITASNGVNPAATQTFTLSVNQVPAITSANHVTFQTGSHGTFSVTTTGFPITSLSDGGATLPSGVTFVDNGNGTATLAGTPGATTGGVYTFTITASNGISPAATQSFTLTVNQAPAITSAASTTFLVGAAVSGSQNTFKVTTTGFPSGTQMLIGLSGGTLPSGVTLVDNHDGTATLSGVPAAGTGGTYLFNITASNGVTPTAIQPFVLTVNEAPAITSANHTTFQTGNSGTFSVTTTGYPKSPGMTVSDGSATLPSGVTFVDNGNGTATLAGTPGANAGGVYTFRITASNGVSPAATQTFTLTVNQAPAFTSAGTTTFFEGQSGSFTVTTSGFPGGASMQISDGNFALPSAVTFHDNGDGTATLSGIPAVGTHGRYTITLTAKNGVNPPATQKFVLVVAVSVTVNDQNRTIVAGAGQAIGAKQTSSGLSFTYLGNVSAKTTSCAVTDLTTGGGSVSVDWGDSTTSTTSSASVVVRAIGPASNCSFAIYGSHVYAHAASPFIITVTVTHRSGGTATLIDHAFIDSAPITRIIGSGDYCAAGGTGCTGTATLPYIQSGWTFADAEMYGSSSLPSSKVGKVIAQCRATSLDTNGVLHQQYAVVDTVNGTGSASGTSVVGGTAGIVNVNGHSNATGQSTVKVALFGGLTDAVTISGVQNTNNTFGPAPSASVGRQLNGSLHITITGDIANSHFDTTTHSWVPDATPVTHNGSLSCTVGSSINTLQDASPSRTLNFGADSALDAGVNP